MSRKEEIEARKVELREEIEAAEDTAKVEELNEEVDALVEEEEQIEQQEKQEEVAEQLEEKKVTAKEIIKDSAMASSVSLGLFSCSVRSAHPPIPSLSEETLNS